MMSMLSTSKSGRLMQWVPTNKRSRVADQRLRDPEAQRPRDTETQTLRAHMFGVCAWTFSSLDGDRVTGCPLVLVLWLWWLWSKDSESQ
jgi:hypothetical protein